MASHEETRSILRRILYITIFLFAIFGLTSIGVLVDAARKGHPVSLTTALLLLSILLAFLVIFVIIIICLSRRATQRQGWREQRDIESRWIAGPDGNRYLPRNDTELRELKRLEKKERKQRDRQRDIQNAIAKARDRIEGRTISSPRDPRDVTTGQPLHRASAKFLPQPGVGIFGHGTTGIFGARPALGGALNPNHGLSPPTSPRSPARVLPKETTRQAEERRRREKKAPVEKAAEVKDSGESGAPTAIASTKPAALNLSAVKISPHRIPMKEVGTPPKGDRGALSGPGGLRVVNNGVGDNIGGAVIGIAGERLDGLRSHKVPSGIVAHGLIAIPPLVKAKTVPLTETDRWSMKREERRRGNGWHERRKDNAPGLVPGYNSNGERRSGDSKKSWKDMSADEIQAEVRREKAKNEKHSIGTPKRVKKATRIPRILDDKHHGAKRAAEEFERDRRTAKTVKRNNERAATVLGQTRKDEDIRCSQGMGRMAEVEQRLCHQATTQSTSHELRPRKSSETYPMPRLSAIPHRLHPQQQEKKAKKEAGKTAKPRLDLTASAYEKHTVEVVQCPPEQATNSLVLAPLTASYNPYVAYKPAAVANTYHSPRVEEVGNSEEESEWQTRRRQQDLARQREEEVARLALIAAFKPPSPPRPRSSSFPPPSPLQRPKSLEGGWEGWHQLYKSDAKKRGVTGFTCTTSTTEVERSEGFESFEEVMREMEEVVTREGAMVDVGVAKPFSQMRGIDHHNRLAIPNLSPKEIGSAEVRNGEDKMPDYVTAEEAQLALAQLERMDIGEHNALDTLPSQQKLATYQTADEAQVALSKLPVVSLQSTERGTTFSSFPAQPSTSTPAKEGQSGIPRLAPGSIKTPASGAKVKPLPGQFGYNNARRANLDLTLNKGGSSSARGAGARQKGEVKKPGLSQSEQI